MSAVAKIKARRQARHAAETGTVTPKVTVPEPQKKTAKKKVEIPVKEPVVANSDDTVTSEA